MGIMALKLPIWLFLIQMMMSLTIIVLVGAAWIGYRFKDIALILNKDGRFDLKFIGKKAFNKDGGAVIGGKLYLSLADKSMNLITGNRRLYIYDNGNPIPRTDIMFGDNKGMDSKTILKYVNDKNLQDLASETINPKIIFMILFLSGINVIFIALMLIKQFNFI